MAMRLCLQNEQLWGFLTLGTGARSHISPDTGSMKRLVILALLLFLGMVPIAYVIVALLTRTASTPTLPSTTILSPLIHQVPLLLLFTVLFFFTPIGSYVSANLAARDRIVAVWDHLLESADLLYTAGRKADAWVRSMIAADLILQLAHIGLCAYAIFQTDLLGKIYLLFHVVAYSFLVHSLLSVTALHGVVCIQARTMCTQMHQQTRDYTMSLAMARKLFRKFRTNLRQSGSALQHHAALLTLFGCVNFLLYMAMLIAVPRFSDLTRILFLAPLLTLLLAMLLTLGQCGFLSAKIQQLVSTLTRSFLDERIEDRTCFTLYLSIDAKNTGLGFYGFTVKQPFFITVLVLFLSILLIAFQRMLILFLWPNPNPL